MGYVIITWYCIVYIIRLSNWEKQVYNNESNYSENQKVVTPDNALRQPTKYYHERLVIQ